MQATTDGSRDKTTQDTPMASEHAGSKMRTNSTVIPKRPTYYGTTSILRINCSTHEHNTDSTFPSTGFTKVEVGVSWENAATLISQTSATIQTCGMIKPS